MIYTQDHGFRLNVGSGQRKFGPGWMNIDCQEKWDPDVVAMGDNMPMFKDGCADIIVLHHVLEHFGCGEALPLLEECRRILRVGGSLLVFVPNMRELARAWIAGKIPTQIYLTNVYGAYMGDSADRHKWGYTTKSLTDFLFTAEYTHVTPFNWREIEGADLAHDWWILALEAIK